MLRRLNAHIIIALCTSCAIIAFAFDQRHDASINVPAVAFYRRRRHDLLIACGLCPVSPQDVPQQDWCLEFCPRTAGDLSKIGAHSGTSTFPRARYPSHDYATICK
jgi:hypothetical protein